MVSMSSSLLSQASAALTALEGLSRASMDYRALSNADALLLAPISASIQRLANTHLALVAGDMALRSSRDLGHSGLAQQQGFRTPEELIRATTGSTAPEAGKAIRAGMIAHEMSSPTPQQPWLAPVGAALSGGALSVSAAEAIRVGLGEPSSAIDAPTLASAASQLCEEAAELDADALQRRARALRNELDEAGIADREAARRSQRSLRFTRLPDGMALLTWRLDPESAAVCGELFDRATSPKRGGPRFVNKTDASKADRMLNDERTVEQLASDTFLELLRHGAAADSSQLLGSGGPVVRAITRREVLDTGEGHGWIEGQDDPICAETVERLSCEGYIQLLEIDAEGNPLDVGREQRLFTRKQRIALAARDGGCRFGDCSRPPSWTEAHHIQHWKRDRGKTDIANGILLCRYHHLLLHNNHWEIERLGGEYYLIPPSTANDRRPRLMPAKSHAIGEAVLAGARADLQEDTAVAAAEDVLLTTVG